MENTDCSCKLTLFALLVKVPSDLEQARGAAPSQHGLSSKTMTRITSECGATRFLSIKWP